MRIPARPMFRGALSTCPQCQDVLRQSRSASIHVFSDPSTGIVEGSMFWTNAYRVVINLACNALGCCLLVGARKWDFVPT